MSANGFVRAAVAIVALVPGVAVGTKAWSQTAQAGPAARALPGFSAPVGGAIGCIDVVTAAQIAATAATDIRAALALVPTLVVNDTGGSAGLVTLSVRGSSSRQVLVLVDGHRVHRTPSAAFDLNDLAVPVERIERIEVIPAPASVIYGPDALGGVVNIVTLPAGATPALAVSYGRGAEADQRIAGGLQFGVKKLGLRVDGQWLTGDGYRENGDYDTKSFTAGVALAPAPWGLDVRWTSYNRGNGVPGTAAHPSPEARQEDSHDSLRADVVYLPGSGWDVKAGVFTRSQTLQYTGPALPAADTPAPVEPAGSGQEYSSSGVEVKMDVDTKGGEIYTVGGEWVGDSVNGDSGGDHTVERWSVFTQDQWRNGDWSAVIALRRDEHSVYGGRTNPSLSVGWGSGGWKAWAAWARNFRTPSFDELYLDGQYVKGNPGLKPETSDSYDGGIEMGGGGGRVRLSAFQRSVDNLIVWAGGDGDFEYRPENVAKATISGWEAQVLYRPTATIAIPVGYQRLSTQDDEMRGSLPGAVRSLWRAAVQGNGKNLTWSLEYAATNRNDARQSGEVRNYTVINAALGWRDTVGSVPVQVSVRAENLQNRDYETVEGYPMRGLSWFAQVRVGL